MDYEKIGKRIKNYRLAAAMTQETLGEASHYSTQHINKVKMPRQRQSEMYSFHSNPFRYL